jgi:hypothetical protein
MSDEIYRLMKKNLFQIKSATPIEGFYDANTMEEKADEEIFDESEEYAPGKLIQYKVKDYKQTFAKVLENIFVFFVDPEKLDNPVGEFLIRFAGSPKPEIKFRNIEDAIMPISYLRYVPELQNFVKQKAEESNIKLEDSILLFLSSKKEFAALSKSPEFIMHDIGHTVSSGEIGLDASRKIERFFMEKIAEMYINENTQQPLSQTPELIPYIYSAKGKFMDRAENIMSVSDWGNSLFAKAMSGRKGYVSLPEEFSMSIRNPRTGDVERIRCKLKGKLQKQRMRRTI